MMPRKREENGAMMHRMEQMNKNRGKTMAKRILIGLLAIAITLTGWPASWLGGSNEAYADSDDRNITPPPGFENQDIASITIDYKKIESTTPPASNFSSTSARGFTWSYSGGRVTATKNDIPFYGDSEGADFINPGSFSLTYPDAAIYPDGSRGDVTIHFTNIRFATKYREYSNGRYINWGANTYSASIQVFNASGGHPYPSLALVSGSSDYRIGVRAEVGITVSNSSNPSNTTNTLIYTAYGFNVNRDSATDNARNNFGELAYASANGYWSESTTAPAGASVGTEFRTFTAGGVTVYAGNGGTNTNSYGSGIALTTQPAQSLHTVRSGTGKSPATTDAYMLPDGITHTTTSSSGTGGKIEVWTSGQKDTGTQLRDSETAERMYDVPDGKVVEYKMTPADGYIIKTVKVDKGDGSGAQFVLPATAVFGSDGKPEYYTYKFLASDIKDNTIHVEWQKAKEITVTKEWEGDDDWKADTRPSDVTVQLFGNDEKFEGQSNTPHSAGVSKAIAYDGETDTITAKYSDSEQKLDDSNTWTYTYKYLPQVDMYGNDIAYSIKELQNGSPIDNNGKLTNGDYRYTVTYDPSTPSTSDTDFKVTNTLDTEQLKVKKTTAGPIDTSETFDFTATLGDTKSSTATAKGLKNGDTKTFTFTVGTKTGIKDIPYGMQYTVTEDDNKGYIETSNNTSGKMPEGGVTAEFTNTAPTTELTINKSWDDAKYFQSPATDSDVDNQYDRDAQTLTYTITAEDSDGNDVTSLIPSGKDTITLSRGDADASDSSKWSDTLTGLPVLAAGGKQIKYTITESTVPAGWKAVATSVTATPAKKNPEPTSGDQYEASADFTNTPAEDEDIKSIDLTIKKVDKNTGNGLAGATFDIKDTAGTTVTTNATANDGTVTYTFTKDGTYTITENTAPTGYEKNTTSYKVKVNKKLTKIELVDGGDASSNNKIWKWFYDLLFGTDSGDMPADFDPTSDTLTVEDEPIKADIEVTKTWDDSNDQDGKRKSTSVKVEKSTDGSNWSPVTGGTATVDKSYTTKTTVLTLNDQPAYEDGDKIQYKVSEDTVTEYDTEYVVNGGSAASSAPTFVLVKDDDDSQAEDKTVDITNKYTPKTTSLKVEKAWLDTGSDLFDGNDPVDDYKRPDITVKVKGVYTDDNGDEQVAYQEKEITLSGVTEEDTTKWTSEELKDLPVFYDHGKQVTYKVVETVPNAYTGTKSTDDITPTLNTATNKYECSNATLQNTPIEDEAYNDLELTIKKVDAKTDTGADLKGAVFTVSSDVPSASEDVTTGDDGTVNYTFKKPGTYKIKEKTAPTGYEKNTSEYEVVVKEGEIVSVTEKDADADHANGFWEKLYKLIFGGGAGEMPAEYDDSTNTLTIKDEPITAKLDVEKLWDDEEDLDGFREGTTVALWKKVGDGEWEDTGEIKDVNKTPTSEGSKFSVGSWNDLVTYEDGQVVYYKVVEDVDEETSLKTNGYTTTYTANSATVSSNDGIDLLNDDDTDGEDKAILVTNSYTRQKANIKVSKKWNDERDSANRTDLTFEISAKDDDGNDVELKYVAGSDKGNDVGTKDLTTKKDGSVQWDDLPVVKDGKPLTYTVKETGADDAYQVVYSPETLTLVDGETAEFKIENTLGEPEEREITRAITYKYIDENGEEVTDAVSKTIKITRTPKRVDPVTGDVIEWNDWEASEGFDEVASPTYDASDDSTKAIKGWKPETDKVDKMTVSDISEILNSEMPSDYDDMTDDEKDAFWESVSKDKFSPEVYYEQKEPPADSGNTIDGLYATDGKIKSQTWKPSDSFKNEVVDYAVLPDGKSTPNEITGYTLIDPTTGEETTTVTTSEGKYKINPDTGEVTFTPVDGFNGSATTVTIRVKDKLGEETGEYPTATYTPTVLNNKETKTVSRTVTFTYESKDGKQASKTIIQTLDFTRVGAYDPATGTIVYTNNWRPVDGDTFPAVDAPVIDGWTPNMTRVPALTITDPGQEVDAVYVIYQKDKNEEDDPDPKNDPKGGKVKKDPKPKNATKVVTTKQIVRKVRTGDPMAIGLILILLAVAATGIFFATRRRHRE